MKNFEIYEDEIRKFKDGNFCEEFVIPHILKSDSCAYLSCSDCGRRQMLWFIEEYEEPEVDWSQVEVDTPILVKHSELVKWKKRHFAKYENGLVYAWNNGETSWTTVAMTDWNYAKLAEDEKELEVDWGKTKVDTPILVRQGKNGKWKKMEGMEKSGRRGIAGDGYAERDVWEGTEGRLGGCHLTFSS